MNGVLIIDLRKRPNKHRISAEVRRKAVDALMWAQDGICAGCERPFPAAWGPDDPAAPTIDHVTPIARGGRSEIENLLLKHGACNTQRGNSWPNARDRKWQAIVATALGLADGSPIATKTGNSGMNKNHPQNVEPKDGR